MKKQKEMMRKTEEKTIYLFSFFCLIFLFSVENVGNRE